MSQPPPYTDVYLAPSSSLRSFVTPCACGFRDNRFIPSDDYRRRLLSHVIESTGGQYPVTKNSAHRARSAPAYKDVEKAHQKRQEKENEKRVIREKALNTRKIVSASKKREKMTQDDTLGTQGGKRK